MKKLLETAFFAARKHTHQRRKNIEDIPYINHPLEVADLLSSAGGITDEDILCAALLHDTVEDTGTRIAEIESLFGPVVAGYVTEVSDDRSLPKEERKRLQVQHAGSLSPGATLIKLADRISNLRSIMAEPPKGWTIGRQLEYFRWSKEVFENLPKKGEVLEDLFRKTYQEGWNVVLSRDGDDQSYRTRLEVVKKKMRAYFYHFTRFGPP
jgi:GTP diphosphokinase / guanosine-3',5'-bis(diphosphate) 3'-diphosphatase